MNISSDADEIRKLRKLLADANRGAEINAHINNSLTAKLAEAREKYRMAVINWQRECYKLRREREALIEAAKAVVDRWDQPSWKDAEPTAAVIYRLRNTVQEITGEELE